MRVMDGLRVPDHYSYRRGGSGDRGSGGGGVGIQNIICLTNYDAPDNLKKKNIRQFSVEINFMRLIFFNIKSI